MNGASRVIDILWTGGWDSTYRVMGLIQSGYQVRPHYIVDPGRASRGVELKTIATITDRLNKIHGNVIQTVKAVDLESTSVPGDIADAFDEIRKHNFVGNQYEWLAAYVSSNKIEFMELSIHKDDKACDLIADFIVEDCLGRLVLGPEAPMPIRRIFGNFSYPIIHMSKSDMKDASQGDTAGIMALTWFCHTPTFGRYPCGHCNPCIYTAQEGLIERLPWLARIRFYCRIYPRLKQILIRFPSVHRALLKVR